MSRERCESNHFDLNIDSKVMFSSAILAPRLSASSTAAKFFIRKSLSVGHNNHYIKKIHKIIVRIVIATRIG